MKNVSSMSIYIFTLNFCCLLEQLSCKTLKRQTLSLQRDFIASCELNSQTVRTSSQYKVKVSSKSNSKEIFE